MAPLGSGDVVVTVNMDVTLVTLMLNDWVAVSFAVVSVTCTWNGYVPNTVGVPAICPCALRFSPGGKIPVPASDQVTGPVAPTELRVWE